MPRISVALTETENTTPNVILASLSRSEAWDSGIVEGVEIKALVCDTTEGRKPVSAGKVAVPSAKSELFCICITSEA